MKSQSMVASFQMMGQSWSVGKERGGMAERNAKGAGPGAGSCSGTWIFSLRRWGGTEEFKQEDNVECGSMCMYIFICVNIQDFMYIGKHTSYIHLVYICAYIHIYVCVRA